jgi:probable rRNA maturation factor
MILNRQSRIPVDLPALRAYARRLRVLLRLGRRDFNVCFVDDGEIERLNTTYRGKRRPTDVLSFPWLHAPSPGWRPPPPRDDAWKAQESSAEGDRNHGFKDFLGDVAISAETARRNARREGHSTSNEIRWLILHGLLHLLGYDHATDSGEMKALEYSLRDRLAIQASSLSRRRNPARWALHG